MKKMKDFNRVIHGNPFWWNSMYVCIVLFNFWLTNGRRSLKLSWRIFPSAFVTTAKSYHFVKDFARFWLFSRHGCNFRNSNDVYSYIVPVHTYTQNEQHETRNTYSNTTTQNTTRVNTTRISARNFEHGTNVFWVSGSGYRNFLLLLPSGLYPPESRPRRGSVKKPRVSPRSLVFLIQCVWCICIDAEIHTRIQRHRSISSNYNNFVGHHVSKLSLISCYIV